VKTQDAPYAYDGLDRLFHEKARLGIVSSLIGHEKGLTFNDLKSLCGLTDGNLSRHLQILEESGCIEIHKELKGKRPCTRCRMSEDGYARFSDYLKVLEGVINNASTGEEGENFSSAGLLRG